MQESRRSVFLLFVRKTEDGEGGKEGHRSCVSTLSGSRRQWAGLRALVSVSSCIDSSVCDGLCCRSFHPFGLRFKYTDVYQTTVSRDQLHNEELGAKFLDSNGTGSNSYISSHPHQRNCPISLLCDNCPTLLCSIQVFFIYERTYIIKTPEYIYLIFIKELLNIKYISKI